LILDNGKVVGHFKTLTALNQLDIRRKSILIRSLYDAKLITIQRNSKPDDSSILEVQRVDLSGITFGSSRNSADERTLYYYVDWYHLFLPNTILTNASFRHTILDCAIFSMSCMDSVDLSFAIHRQPNCFDTLRGFQRDFLNTSLIKANLYDANFYYNDFSSANLTLANMRQFYCQECKFSNIVLLQADLSSSIFFHAFYLGTLRLDFSAVNLTL
jgi:uncharacterized protein YjbI with pentapeptide repeats